MQLSKHFIIFKITAYSDLLRIDRCKNYPLPRYRVAILVSPPLLVTSSLQAKHFALCCSNTVVVTILLATNLNKCSQY